MKILSVDDSKIIRRLVSSMMEIVDHETLEATNGAEALEVLEKESQDIAMVILDWNMPVMDGLTCLQKIKAHPEWSKIPVMMLTTESQAEKIATALREGASNYLTKPFSQEQLIEKVFDTLGLS